MHVVRTVDEAVELLMGLPAGTLDAEGRWPNGCLNHRVEARLEQLARAARTDAGIARG